jgi:hypothetical protein
VCLGGGGGSAFPVECEVECEVGGEVAGEVAGWFEATIISKPPYHHVDLEGFPRSCAPDL